ncbi:hypothetical protein ACHAPT_003840 [Fusarium lateritium]
MLKWCQAILSATEGRRGDEAVSQVTALLPNMARLFESTTIINPTSDVAGNYCLGWVRQTAPATLGMISPNRRFCAPVLGKDSPSKLVYSHNGDVKGYMASMCLFPEEEAAIVALTNATGMGDCTDWIVQDLAQEMFSFQPANDYAAFAKQFAKSCASRYQDKFVVPLQEH